MNDINFNLVKHNWKVVGVGNWSTEYQCSKCKLNHVAHDDDSDTFINNVIDDCYKQKKKYNKRLRKEIL